MAVQFTTSRQGKCNKVFQDNYDRSKTVLRGIAYNSSTKGKCANTNKNEITENCEAEKWGSKNTHTTAIIDDVSKENTEVENDKKVLFDNVTEED